MELERRSLLAGSGCMIRLIVGVWVTLQVSERERSRMAVFGYVVKMYPRMCRLFNDDELCRCGVTNCPS